MLGVIQIQVTKKTFLVLRTTKRTSQILDRKSLMFPHKEYKLYWERTQTYTEGLKMGTIVL